MPLPPVVHSLPTPPPPLHTTKQARYPVQEESYKHRTAAHLFATGILSIKEVAAAVEMNERTVQNLCRQKWFQENVLELMAENGTGDIMSLFKAEAMNSLITLVEIRDSEKCKASDRLTAAKDILDRGQGKALTRMELSEAPSSLDPVAEERRLLEENARLKL